MSTNEQCDTCFVEQKEMLELNDRTGAQGICSHMNENDNDDEKKEKCGEKRKHSSPAGKSKKEEKKAKKEQKEDNDDEEFPSMIEMEQSQITPFGKIEKNVVYKIEKAERKNGDIRQ